MSSNQTSDSSIDSITINLDPLTDTFTLASSGNVGSYEWNYNNITLGKSSITDTISVSDINTIWNSHWDLEVKGDAKISGNLEVGGKNIADSLDRIEERLAILRPNEELEEKWENLRGLRKAYMELEKEILEKEKMWNILKK